MFNLFYSSEWWKNLIITIAIMLPVGAAIGAVVGALQGARLEKRLSKRMCEDTKTESNDKVPMDHDTIRCVASQLVILLGILFSLAIIHYGKDKWEWARPYGVFVIVLFVVLSIFILLFKKDVLISKKTRKADMDIDLNVQAKESVVPMYPPLTPLRNLETDTKGIRDQVSELLSLVNQLMEITNGVSDMVKEVKYQKEIREDNDDFYYNRLLRTYLELKDKLKEERNIKEKLLLENNELRKLL